MLVIVLAPLLFAVAAVAPAAAWQAPVALDSIRITAHRLSVVRLPVVEVDFEVRAQGGRWLRGLAAGDIAARDVLDGTPVRVLGLEPIPGAQGLPARTVIVAGGNLFYRSPEAEAWILANEELVARLTPGSDRLGMVVPKDSMPEIVRPSTNWDQAIALIRGRVDSADVSDGALLGRALGVAEQSGGAGTVVFYIGPVLPGCGTACRARWKGIIAANRMTVVLVPLSPGGRAAWERLAREIGALVLAGDPRVAVRGILAGVGDTTELLYRAILEGQWEPDGTHRSLELSLATDFPTWTPAGVSTEVPFVALAQAQGGLPATRRMQPEDQRLLAATFGTICLLLLAAVVLVRRRQSQALLGGRRGAR